MDYVFVAAKTSAGGVIVSGSNLNDDLIHLAEVLLSVVTGPYQVRSPVHFSSLGWLKKTFFQRS